MKPLYDRITKVGEKQRFRYCTPAHGGRAICSFLDGVLKYDLTELPDTDNLWRCNSVISNAEELAAKCFFADNTCFITTGASTAVKAAIFLSARGKKIICDRFCHHSAVDGLVLSRAQPVWLTGKFNREFSAPCPPTAEDVEKLLKEHCDAAAVFITSPNYFGLTADIAGIKAVCRKHNALLVVDNSHGTHFAFIDQGKNHPMNLGADICIDSAHKTLPVLTGGAMLHTKGFAKAQAKQALSLFSSSSPSYLTLSSLDFAREYADGNRGDFAAAVKATEDFCERLRCHGISVLPAEDKLRVTVAMGDSEKAYNMLYKKGIAPEMHCGASVVFIIPPKVTTCELNLLATYIEMIYNETKWGEIGSLLIIPENKRAMSMEDAVFSKKKTVSLCSCVGEISACTVTVYPPSVPVLLPGEVISRESADIIARFTDFNEISAVDYVSPGKVSK